MCHDHGWTSSNYCVFATTGKAASSIDGSTVQNYTTGLCYFSGRAFKPLSSNLLQKFQARMKNTRLVIIDEFSMLGQGDLHIIDKRLQEGKNCDLLFGGIVVVLCGDPAQLPAVKANCLWFDKPKNGSNDYRGRWKYKEFDTVVELTENNRIDRSDPEAQHFATFLNALRDGENTREQWEYVCKKCSQHSMDKKRWKTEFESVEATHLFCTNKEVAKRNVLCLQSVGAPIVLIEASHTGHGHRANESCASGLQKKIYLCKGAKVLLTKNIWQMGGLCNGACGVVREIIYDPLQPPPALPMCVVVDFGEAYLGQTFFPNDDTKSKWVPLFPHVTEWNTPEKGDVIQSSRKMFPIKLCYAWTIWKAQGQTITNNVVLSLGDREREHGLSYTAFSRVRRFSSLGILGGISFIRLTDKIRNHSKMEGRIKEERRLRKLCKQTRKDLSCNGVVI